MKIRILTQAILIIALTLTTGLYGQITIGSGQKANPGTLLDLKMEGNTSKGLVLPRVKLTDTDNLYPMFETTPGSGTPNSNYNTTAKKAAEDALHTGLVVYNTNYCLAFGNGLYIWDGTEWQKLGNRTLAGISFNQEYFDLPSGRDGRRMDPQTLTITWPGGIGSIAPTWTAAASSPFTAIPFTVTPLAPNPLVNSPENMTLLPNMMSTNEVSTEPWKTKETILTFTYSECGQTRSVTLNQTRYALKINNQFDNSTINYAAAGNRNFNVEGNTSWTLSISGVLASLINVTPTSGGTDLKDGTSVVSNVELTIGTGGDKYDAAKIIFKDTQTSKRIDDIIVSVVNCNVGLEPTIKEWASRAGFPNVDDPKVSNANDIAAGINTPNPVTGIAWHRDQDGNIFFSSEFGAAGRWMITNLAAKKYDSSRTDGSNSATAQSTIINNSYGKNYPNPQWGYPTLSGSTNPSDVTYYNSNKRLGLLYNWAAATLKKGGSNGEATINDAGTNHAKVQGICPSGWHLPSDYEWTKLENEIQTNTSKYSSINDIGGTISQPGEQPNYRLPIGQAMTDPCATTLSMTITGASNIISSSTLGGFSVLFPGTAVFDDATNLESSTEMWTSSGYTQLTSPRWAAAYVRRISRYSNPPSRFDRGISDRHIYASVRCKKD